MCTQGALFRASELVIQKNSRIILFILYKIIHSYHSICHKRRFCSLVGNKESVTAALSQPASSSFIYHYSHLFISKGKLFHIVIFFYFENNRLYKCIVKMN